MSTQKLSLSTQKLPESPQKLPESPQKLPDSSQTAPRSSQKPPESPQKLPESPIEPKEAPRELPEAPDVGQSAYLLKLCFGPVRSHEIAGGLKQHINTCPPTGGGQAVDSLYILSEGLICTVCTEKACGALVFFVFA